MGWLVYISLGDNVLVLKEISTCTLVSNDFSVILLLLRSTFSYASEHDNSRKELILWFLCSLFFHWPSYGRGMFISVYEMPGFYVGRLLACNSLVYEAAGLCLSDNQQVRHKIASYLQKSELAFNILYN